MLSKLNRSPVGAETFGAKFIQFLIFNSDIGGSGFQRKRYIFMEGVTFLPVIIEVNTISLNAPA